MTNVVIKKKPSPSSLRRSARCRQEFLKKKIPTTSVESTPSAKCSKEDTQKKGMESTTKNPFKCDQCDSQFENEKGLKCHEGKMHKVTLSPIPQVDGHSEYHEVTIPLELTMENCLHLKYDKPPASVIHPEKGRGIYYDTDPRDGQSATSLVTMKFGTAMTVQVSLELLCRKNHRSVAFWHCSGPESRLQILHPTIAVLGKHFTPTSQHVFVRLKYRI